MKKTFILISLVCFSVIAHAQSINKDLLINLNDHTIKEVKENQFIYIDFENIDFDIIPLLIHIIDSNTRSSSSCPISPYSSNIPNIYIGEIAAKYIEYIINPYFEFDRITKEGKYYSLQIEDLKNIKKIYLEWWEENKQFSKEELRKRQKIKRILNTSIYKWETCP
jgi:hypothetical protein